MSSLAPLRLYFRVSSLEVKLESELNYAPTVFVYDLAEVVFGGLVIIITLSWIAYICGSSSSVWDIHMCFAGCLKRQVDVTRAKTTCGCNLTGVSLIENVEEPCSKLKLL